MRKILIILLALSPLTLGAQEHGRRPKLVVNVVVSGVSKDLLDKFRPNLSEEGFVRFAAEGTDFSKAYYPYMQTLTPTGLATLTTGADPSMHGIVSHAWIDYVTGRRVGLVEDAEVQGLGMSANEGAFSPLHIVMPALGDELLDSSPESKVVGVAADAVSAVVSAGMKGTAYWMDPARASWHSSTHYMSHLPDWVVAYNVEREATKYLNEGWSPARPREQYINRASTIFAGGTGRRINRFDNYGELLRSPMGNTLVASFAGRLVAEEGLGRDDAPDILNVCFDPARRVGEIYGSAAMETEDMIYRLDMELSGLVRAVTRQVPLSDVLFVITADHGLGDGEQRFNVAQFRTVLNSFLVAQFGPGEWVTDYIDRQLYLNRNLIYQSGLNLADVQSRAATFALQFRGVSHVLTSTALGGGYFGGGWGGRMQRSFYPRRAGDLMLNLMPGWVEEREGVRSLPGSMYDYDTHVPLMFFGWDVPFRAVTEHVDMTSVAPTLAHILGLARPIASESETLTITE